MKVLWLCNVMLPMIAEQLHKEATNKEGWITGLVTQILADSKSTGIELCIAFPCGEDLLENGETVFERKLSLNGSEVSCYGFKEDTGHPEIYDETLEKSLGQIVERAGADMVHCFGTEFPHTLAMCRVFPRKDKILITIQGLCSVYANTYFADLPDKVKQSVTFRDWLKKDTLRRQQEKFVKRGEMEIAAIKLAGNIGGRTPWDRHYAKEWNPEAEYFVMHETLRKDFYQASWNPEKCEPHSIFISQGDYPIKGLHYLLCAMPKILAKYPDTKVYVAGNSVVNFSSLKEKIKIGAYGKYLRSLLAEYRLFDKVIFLGRQNAEQMKERYLSSSLYLCCSSIENSPNSLGEAMLLGMPCVSADVGGIPGIFTDGEDGILYPGSRSMKNSFDRQKGDLTGEEAEGAMERIADNLAEAVLKMWSDEKQQAVYRENAHAHALRNHDPNGNLGETVEVYSAICSKS